MTDITFAGGVVLGLASALHCGAMCGGIACGAMMLIERTSPGGRLLQLGVMQAGRVSTYCVIGAVAGAVGLGALPVAAAQNSHLLQWAAAMSMMWTGLVLAGAMPNLVWIDRAFLILAGGADRALRTLSGRRTTGAFALGVVWGLNACPMVYGAALVASFTGSVWRGMLFMAGFGIGTVPAVVAVATGASALRRLALSPAARISIGAGVAALGCIIALAPSAYTSVLCGVFGAPP